jgi:hypothetical protein
MCRTISTRLSLSTPSIVGRLRRAGGSNPVADVSPPLLSKPSLRYKPATKSVSAVIPGSSASSSNDANQSYGPIGLLPNRPAMTASFLTRRPRFAVVFIVQSWISSSSKSSDFIRLMFLSRLSSMALISVPLIWAFFAMSFASSSHIDQISAAFRRRWTVVSCDDVPIDDLSKLSSAISTDTASSSPRSTPFLLEPSAL